MSTSKLMQKLRMQHAKQVKRLKQGVRNNANVKPTPRVPAVKNGVKNLNTAVAKMKAMQNKLKKNRNNRAIKVVKAKK